MKKRHEIGAPRSRPLEDCPEPVVGPRACGDGGVIIAWNKGWNAVCECGLTGEIRQVRDEAMRDLRMHRASSRR